MLALLQRAFGALALLGLGWLLSRSLRDAAGRRGASSSRQRAPRRGPTPTREQEPMVRDRVCNTFLPRSRAMAIEVDGEEHYFCSSDCRERFLAAGTAPLSPEARS